MPIINAPEKVLTDVRVFEDINEKSGCNSLDVLFNKKIIMKYSSEMMKYIAKHHDSKLGCAFWTWTGHGDVNQYLRWLFKNNIDWLYACHESYNFCEYIEFFFKNVEETFRNDYEDNYNLDINLKIIKFAYENEIEMPYGEYLYYLRDLYMHSNVLDPLEYSVHLHQIKNILKNTEYLECCNSVIEHMIIVNKNK